MLWACGKSNESDKPSFSYHSHRMDSSQRPSECHVSIRMASDVWRRWQQVSKELNIKESATLLEILLSHYEETKKSTDGTYLQHCPTCHSPMSLYCPSCGTLTSTHLHQKDHINDGELDEKSEEMKGTSTQLAQELNSKNSNSGDLLPNSTSGSLIQNSNSCNLIQNSNFGCLIQNSNSDILLPNSNSGSLLQNSVSGYTVQNSNFSCPVLIQKVHLYHLETAGKGNDEGHVYGNNELVPQVSGCAIPLFQSTGECCSCLSASDLRVSTKRDKTKLSTSKTSTNTGQMTCRFSEETKEKECNVLGAEESEYTMSLFSTIDGSCQPEEEEELFSHTCSARNRGAIVPSKQCQGRSERQKARTKRKGKVNCDCSAVTLLTKHEEVITPNQDNDDVQSEIHPNVKDCETLRTNPLQKNQSNDCGRHTVRRRRLNETQNSSGEIEFSDSDVHSKQTGCDGEKNLFIQHGFFESRNHEVKHASRENEIDANEAQSSSSSIIKLNQHQQKHSHCENNSDFENGEGRSHLSNLCVQSGEKQAANNSVFKGTQCDLTLSSCQQLDNHQRKSHGDLRPQFPCQFCGKVLRSKYSLKAHLGNHTGVHPYKCGVDKCGESFSLSSTFKAHMRKHSGDCPYLCPYCGKSFVRSSNLSTHIRACTGQKPYACPTCGKTFSDAGYYKKHINNHQGIRRYKCQYCGKEFAQATSLKHHIRTHTREKPYACPQCPLTFALAASLKGHQRTHSGLKPYKCPLCEKMFAKSCNRLVHLRTHQQKSQM